MRLQEMDLPGSCTLGIDVDYYDVKHEAALKSIHGIKAALDRVAGKTIDVPQGEFLTYSLFTELGAGPRHFATLASIQKVAKLYALPLTNYFLYPPSIKLRKEGYEPGNALRERIGVALGLSIASRIHGLTLADWVRIPVLPTPHLDFHLASTGKRKVQVETKGSVVPDNQFRAGLSKHASSVAHKKGHLAALPEEPTQWEASVRYGTIAAIDHVHQAKVWLLDPEPEPVMWNPKQLQLLARFGFIAGWLSLISPYSKISSALYRRFEELIAASDPFEFDGRRLEDPNGNAIETDVHRRVDVPGSFFFGKLSYDERLAVRLVPLRPGQAMLLGVRRDLVKLAINQDFQSILNYRTDPVSLDGVLSASRIRWQRNQYDRKVVMHETSFGTAISLVDDEFD